MALTRKYLKAMGIEDEKIDEIISAHSETVEALKEQRDSYKASAEKLAPALKEIDRLKEEVEAGKGDEWKTKYQKTQAEFDAYKSDIESKETLAAKKSALTDLAKDFLSDHGVTKAVKYADWDSIELDEKGNITNAKEHIKNLKEEWSDYVVKEGAKGADTPKPPTGNGGGGAKTREEIMEIKDTQERQAAWADYLSNEGEE